MRWFGFAAVVAASTALSGCDLFLSDMARACQDKLVARLKSPASYSRVSLAESKEDMEIGEYRAARITRVEEPDPVKYRQISDKLDEEVAAMRAAGAKPARLTARIVYDAQNGFGAMLRGSATCDYLSKNGSYPAIDSFGLHLILATD